MIAYFFFIFPWYLGVSAGSSVNQFEDMVAQFKLNTNPKQDSESELPRQQSQPWMITDQDLERNKAKVSNTQAHNEKSQTNLSCMYNEKCKQFFPVFLDWNCIHPLGFRLFVRSAWMRFCRITPEMPHWLLCEYTKYNINNIGVVISLIFRPDCTYTNNYFFV